MICNGTICFFYTVWILPHRTVETHWILPKRITKTHRKLHETGQGDPIEITQKSLGIPPDTAHEVIGDPLISPEGVNKTK